MTQQHEPCITSIGGQALIEGILMRGPKRIEVSVRTPDNSIDSEELSYVSLWDRYPILRLPLLRGVAAFLDSMIMSSKALNVSSEKSGMTDIDVEDSESKLDRWLDKHCGDKLGSLITAIGAVIGIVVAVALFFFVPAALFNLYLKFAGPSAAMWRSPFEGVLRLIIFIVYIGLISFQPDVKRMFRYHGAEHKTIFCYEAGLPLTVENVRKQGRFHPRCGTSFMVLMILVGVLVGLFIPFSNPFIRTFVKLLCIPIVMGIGYELIRYCGRHENHLTRLIAAPGLWMQRPTVKEPDDSMIEVAITSMKKVIPENGEDRIVP
ncbi:MAG TPA: DUF1385 domain-containing protein [Ruminococcaceae bacterium]|nr:DUF1385 domain-containing protein [Oscillospiraceae bacterium]